MDRLECSNLITRWCDVLLSSLGSWGNAFENVLWSSSYVTKVSLGAPKSIYSYYFWTNLASNQKNKIQFKHVVQYMYFVFCIFYFTHFLQKLCSSRNQDLRQLEHSFRVLAQTSIYSSNTTSTNQRNVNKTVWGNKIYKYI